MTPTLVLASASPTRRAILDAAGIAHEVEPSDAPEDLNAASTAELVLALAWRKAGIVAERREHGLVLGCDSLLDLDGHAYGKPSSAEEAERRWRAQRGHTGTLFTGHVLIDATSGVGEAEVVATTVRFGAPSDAEIEAYVASGEPLDKAGAFTLEGRSAPFLLGIDGDAGNVRGLSLPALARLLRAHGLSVTDFWRSS